MKLCEPVVYVCVSVSLLCSSSLTFIIFAWQHSRTLRGEVYFVNSGSACPVPRERWAANDRSPAASSTSSARTQLPSVAHQLKIERDVCKTGGLGWCSGRTVKNSVGKQWPGGRVCPVDLCDLDEYSVSHILAVFHSSFQGFQSL